MIYIIGILFSVFCSFISIKIKNDGKKSNFFKFFFAILSFFFPFLISSFRSINIGTDTSLTYLEIFNNVANGYNGVRDIGYWFINKICLFFSSDYRLVLFFTSFIITSLAYFHIFSKSKYPVLSTYLFFATNVFFISMNMIRQSIATMIFILAIPSIKNRNLFKYFLICFLAISIHSSSILYLPLYFICNRQINIKKSISILLLILFFNRYICALIIQLAIKIPYFQKYFAWYFTSSYNTGRVSLFSLLISVMILIFLFLCQKKSVNLFELNCITWMQIISFICLCFSGLIPMMQRTSWLFSFPLFIYLPNFFDNIDNIFLRYLIRIGLIAGFSIYMIITIFIFKYNQVYPYSSIFMMEVLL